MAITYTCYKNQHYADRIIRSFEFLAQRFFKANSRQKHKNSNKHNNPVSNFNTVLTSGIIKRPFKTHPHLSSLN